LVAFAFAVVFLPPQPGCKREEINAENGVRERKGEEEREGWR